MSLEVKNLSLALGKRQILEQVSFLAEEPLTINFRKKWSRKNHAVKNHCRIVSDK